MAAGVAHDFNNMLHGVVGALDLMQTRLGQGRMDELSDLLQTAQTSLRRTAALTHSLLAFWRPRPVELKLICINAQIVSNSGGTRHARTKGLEASWAVQEECGNRTPLP
jgi:C4-dicarboxylate-specific signal transduction histidine kinase